MSHDQSPTSGSEIAGSLPGDINALVHELDRRRRGHLGMLLGGQSPWAALQAWEDWAFHLMISHAKQIELWELALQASMSLVEGKLANDGPGSEFADRRFRDPAWKHPPFNLLAQVQLAAEAQWHAATMDVPGIGRRHARRVDFLGSFLLNAIAPVNFPWTNPTVLETAWRSVGTSLADGASLLIQDMMRVARGKKLKGLDDFKIGENIATTEGTVVFRNELMELIQYDPTTPQVREEPLLIVPAWIMKYYVLDLSPGNSLVRYLVDQGFTVFMISWKNPGPELRNTSFDDYRSKGVMTAIDVIGKITPGRKLHAVGYCLGGTILAIAAAAMNRDHDERFASLSLLAAQTDFEEAGELMLFIDESELALLEDIMHVQGFLETRQMAGVFYVLRANEMIFAQFVERYLLGQPRVPTDLDAWLADATRMPARMHSEYLRQLFLHNSFAHGNYLVGGRALAIKDISTPVFALGAERDHIAPWRSVYKIELYSSADTEFILTGGGHNSSVVSPPDKPGAYYRVSTCDPLDKYVDPDTWLASASQKEGSWWPEWVRWLDAHSSQVRVTPSFRSNVSVDCLGPAPGFYVFEP
ncbi:MULTISPECIES: alpha/beta fold hydrolase [Bradyrhizobium]|uniref:Alpha/beta fold hydrolase n=1 Tax=Bradyrhizobium elkanii TaxID=29448 RepID=A0A4U6S2W8_BRAEL|nr:MULTISPECIES: alpha/beta fold hydrolase [Bradyrhizobium]MTV15470.1 alpha/beta fold hydrolase [Bradyrhizobium sp. BR2003]TKV81193.1 alpha/beta fold hydrolase [Bradyrhizobium elkanii]